MNKKEPWIAFFLNQVNDIWSLVSKLNVCNWNKIILYDNTFLQGMPHYEPTAMSELFDGNPNENYK